MKGIFYPHDNLGRHINRAALRPLLVFFEHIYCRIYIVEFFYPGVLIGSFVLEFFVMHNHYNRNHYILGGMLKRCEFYH